MTNYIRACLCVDQSIHTQTFLNLLARMDSLGCRYNVGELGYVSGYTSLNQQTITVSASSTEAQPNSNTLLQLATWLSAPGYLEIGFGWRVADNVHSARLLHHWDEQDGRRLVSFDVEDSVFLPGATVTYTPDETFEHFKLLLVELVKHIQPFIGAVDYEADLACSESGTSSLPASWGSYFSWSVVNQWTDQVVQQVLQMTDEHLQIDDNGLLVFIHPLTANQEWTERHERINAFLQHGLLKS